MENEEQIIKDAYKTLSDDVKNIIGSSEWLKRVREIGQKYSLTIEQIDSLGYEILFTFLNLQSPDLLNETIEEELDISSILAEQIVEEIEERIFAWAMKKIEPKQIEDVNTLDIPPVNLPGEVIEESTNSWMPKTVPTTPEKTHSMLQDQVNSFFAPASAAAEPKVEMRPEPTVIPKASFIPPVVQTPPRPQSFISQKLSQPTAPQKYTADPYREPIE